MLCEKIRFFLLIAILLIDPINIISQPRNNVFDKNSALATNYSLNFSGNGYVRLSNKLVNNPDEFTIEAWVKPIEQGTMNGMVFYHGQGGEIELEIGSDLGISFLVNLDTWYAVYSSTKLTIGRWSHIAGVYKRSEQKLKIFINGVLEATVSTPNTDMRESGYFSMIGSYGDAALQKYKGNIDEVRFSNVARYSSDFLTTADLLSDANTIGLWKFNEGVGSITYDASGNGFNGNIIDAQWSSDYPDGLVAYYPFNGNAIDESGYGNNGIVSGASLTNDRFGNANSAYFFDRVNDFIQTPFDLKIEPGNTFTFSCWFKTENIEISGIYLGCGSGDNHIGFGHYYTTRRLWANVRNGTISDYSANTVLYPNTWYHAVFVINGLNLSFYLNGQYDGGGTFNITANPSSNARIGSRDDNWNIFGGALDDIRIYNRALSQFDIQILYHENGWQQFTINTTSNPLYGGTTSGSGFYDNGSNVLVVATPNDGYAFVNWTENGNVVSTTQSYQFIVTSNRNLVANFQTIPTLSVSPLYIGVSSNSGSGQFSVSNTTGGTMNWTAISNNNWITITSGSSGTNNGTIILSYQLNNSTFQRIGTITVTAPDAFNSPQTVEVRQDRIVGVDEMSIPTKFALYQNYPNPFNPRTTVQYQVPKQSFILIKLFNSLGQEIKVLVAEEKMPGNYQTSFDISDLKSGVYFYQMRTKDFVETKKLVLIK